MKSRSRSLSGAIIALLALPIFLGLLACIPSFPVPIGDSEKSRIDPTITGMWVASDGDSTSIYWYIPYDKRTWLLTTYFLELDEEYCDPEESEELDDADAADDIGDVVDLEDEDEFMSYDEIIEFYDAMGAGCFEASASLMMKAWVTELGGRQYITMVIKNMVDPGDGYETAEWLVHTVDRPNPDVLRLGWLSADDDVFEGIDDATATRRKYEKVLRKQGKNPEFSGEDIADYHRVKLGDTDIFTNLIEDVYEL